jgi:NADPH:quinone reductase-like Zn-dependent oxidoreductase
MTASIPDSIKALITQDNGQSPKVASVPFDGSQLGADEILVRVRAVGLNPTDWKSSLRPKVSGNLIVGCDAAGDVVAVGSNVTFFQVGDRAAGFTAGVTKADNGAFAEYVRFSQVVGFKLPENMTYEEGASLPIPHLTAIQSLYIRLGLPTPLKASTSPGATILIWGGSTATGHHAIQLARLSGLHVITTASPEAFTELENIGASLCFNYKDPNVVDKLKAAGDITYALDTVSEGGTIEKTIDALGPNGGKVVHLLTVSDEVKNRRKDVEVLHTLLYLVLGPYAHYPFWPDDQPPMRGYLQEEWPELSKSWKAGLGNARLKPQRLRKLEGGLDGVPKGLETMKSGGYSREKLVATIA